MNPYMKRKYSHDHIARVRAATLPIAEAFEARLIATLPDAIIRCIEPEEWEMAGTLFVAMSYRDERRRMDSEGLLPIYAELTLGEMNHVADAVGEVASEFGISFRHKASQSARHTLVYRWWKDG